MGNLTFDPSFGHNLCFKNPNGSCKFILKFKFQEFFNDIRNFLIQWVLALAIALWRFGSPLGLQLPKWELTWDYGGSFLHNLLHSREHEMWFSGSLLAHTFASPCFDREPKARVATIVPSHIIMIQNQQEFKIQNYNVPWAILVLNAMLIQIM
jgi:hypothetical protein